jgi:hypothetical protein
MKVYQAVVIGGFVLAIAVGSLVGLAQWIVREAAPYTPDRPAVAAPVRAPAPAPVVDQVQRSTPPDDEAVAYLAARYPAYGDEASWRCQHGGLFGPTIFVCTNVESGAQATLHYRESGFKVMSPPS